jgi:thiamine biosynthesis lipoprotein
MRRRDFLSARRLGKAAAQLLEVAGHLRDAERELTQDAVLLRFARRAMATTFEVIFPLGMAHAQAWADAALDEIDRLESQLTVYREDSDVSRLNARAAETSVAVEPSLFELLARARRLWNETGGAFDVTLGALVKAWGFHRREGRVPTLEQLAEARARSGFEHVHLDPENRNVHFKAPGLEINLGSIGKGHALDCVIRLLHRDGNVRHALVHGGHSSVFAMGDEPGSRRGWSIGLLDPENSERRLAVLRLRDRALGVSAATYQHFVHAGRKLGHILDPRSGWPAAGMRLAAATAPTAAEADALATAFYVLGIDGARSYCETHPAIGAALLPEEGAVVLLGRCTGEAELA